MSELPLAAFHEGDRVRIADPDDDDHGAEGEVLSVHYSLGGAPMATVALDGHRRSEAEGFLLSQLAVVESEWHQARTDR